jgi:broad specificity phosphatase PhoE
VLILVRHGQSASNAAGLLVGRSDPGLTELGRAQAEATGRMLASAVPACIVSSPLGRATATAAIIAEESGYRGEILIEDRIIELDYGEFDGRRLAEIPHEELTAWRADPTWRPPGGETLVELQARVELWCRSVADEAVRDDVVAVTHVSPVKAAAAWAMGVGPEISWRMSLPVAAVTRISTTPPSLVSFGETSHLSALA